MTEYAVLAVLLVRAVGREAPALALGVLYAASDELHQAFVRGRHASPIDVAIDTVGLLIGLLVWRRLQSPTMEHREVADRQLDALLERIDRLTVEVAKINRRLEANDGMVRIASELSQLNESLQTLAYAALGRRGPDVRRRAGRLSP